ncbi:ABC transporter ATP-binding protein [Spirochaetia bacterium]|nr:ABC transporter ATP-binding protein [Spirochaetia bacterium]
MPVLISIENLKLVAASHTENKTHKVLVDIDELYIEEGEMLALVGETGSGKSLTAASILRLYPARTIRVEQGKIEFKGKNVLAFSRKELDNFRGKTVSMIFQDPMSALNPVFTAGEIIIEIILTHFDVSPKEAREKALEAFEYVGFPDPEEILSRYPHQLSGGQRQRVCIAMAVVCEPKLLIADEPTTALDVTIQAQILRLIARLKKEKGLSILFITHNLGIVSSMADRLAIMRSGKIVEAGITSDVLKHPEHPYTRMLLDAIPRPNEKRERLPVVDYII